MKLNKCLTMRELYVCPQPRNLLGNGASMNVYKIPDFPELVYRTVRSEPGDWETFSKNRFVINRNFPPSFSFADKDIWFNRLGCQSVVWVGARDSVNIRAPGEVIARHHYRSPQEDKENYLKKLSLLSKCSDSSYEQFCRDVKFLAHKEIGIDALEWNTFFDAQTQRFYMVDLRPQKNCAEPTDSGLSGMASVCILSRKRRLYPSLSASERYKAKICVKNILHKLIKAGKKENIPVFHADGPFMNLCNIVDTLKIMEFPQHETQIVLNELLKRAENKNHMLKLLQENRCR